MKHFTQIMKASALSVLAFALTACTSTKAAGPSEAADVTQVIALEENLPGVELDTSNADGVLKKILDTGILKVATSPDYPPNEYLDAEGNPQGSDMMLAQYIANQLGVQLQIETMDFNAVLTAVDTGKADLALSGFGYKKDRAEQFELSLGYQTAEDGESDANHHGLLVPSEDAGQYQSLADFKGKHILAQASSLQEMYVEDQIADADLELVTALDQGILAMQSGKADAIALDKNTAQNYEAQSNGMFTYLEDMEFDMTPYAEYAGNVAAAKKGETSFIDAVNTIIETVNSEGLYDKWYEQAKKDSGTDVNAE
jgi:ABC-type amino acid transport substrate-binding protein